MTVAAGRSAHFTCVVKHLGGHKVSNTYDQNNSKMQPQLDTYAINNVPKLILGCLAEI